MVSNNMPPMMVMTSPKTRWTLSGFFYLIEKYVPKLPDITIFGFDEDAEDCEHYYPAHFHSFGKFSSYPRNLWSNTFLMAIDKMEERSDLFWFMMDDYWVIRGVDCPAVELLTAYMRKNQDIIKVDLATDRLYARRGEPYLYGRGTIDRIGHLDIIQSDPATDYHMSLWTGLWNPKLLRRIIIEGESAQEIEINGTARLGAMQDIRVIGTRQAPVMHTNIIRGGGEPIYTGYEIEGHPVNGVHIMDLIDMRRKGVKTNV